MNILEKEILFNRYYAGEMIKEELTALVKRLLADKELNEWFTIQFEFIRAFRYPI